LWQRELPGRAARISWVRGASRRGAAAAVSHSNVWPVGSKVYIPPEFWRNTNATSGSTPDSGTDEATVGASPRVSEERLRLGGARFFIHQLLPKWCIMIPMSRTNIDIDEELIRKARKLTRLKTKRQIVERALELLVRSESRKGILRYYGAGIWKGDLKASRRNRS
jgi:Arc/MetJ family transcription regulator